MQAFRKCTIMLAATLVTCSVAAQDRIPWITQLQTARQAAEQQQRLVLLHFSSDTCLPCQRLERYVFNQPELIRAIQSAYIPVKINVDQQQDLAEFYKITSVPTDIIVDPSGREVYRTGSPSDKNGYIAMLDGVKANYAVSGSAPADGYATAAPPSAGRLNHPSPSTTAMGPQTGLGNEPVDLAAPSDGSPLARDDQPSQAVMENPYSRPLNQTQPRQPADTAPAYAQPVAGATSGGGDFIPPADRLGAAQSPSRSAPSWSRQETHSTPPASPVRPWEANGSGLSQTAASPPADARPWQDSPVPGGLSSDPPARSAQNSPAPSQPAIGQPAPGNVQPAPGNVQPNQPPLALDGFCPVSLVTRSTWAKGDPRWGVVHRGKLYLFAGPQEQQQFWADPDRYSPMLSGYDPVRYAQAGQLVPGKREHGVFYRDRVFLFADEQALQQFWADPSRYASVAEQASQAARTPLSR